MILFQNGVVMNLSTIDMLEVQQSHERLARRRRCESFPLVLYFFFSLVPRFMDLISLCLQESDTCPPPRPFLTAANKDQLESAGSPLKRALAKCISGRRPSQPPRHTYADVSPFSLSSLEMREATLGSAGAASSSRVTSMKRTAVKPLNLRPKSQCLHLSTQQP